MEIQTKKFAVLIDADNSSISAIPSVLEEVAKYGIASVKRVYGDWSSETLKNWREVLLPHAITPVQQFAYTKGKDATDMILIIDAMDLLYAGALDGFCIVSSDSDFTPLASRIRENGLSVYGFGKKKTPEAFKKACDKFIYIENLISDIVRTPKNQYNTDMSYPIHFRKKILAKLEEGQSIRAVAQHFEINKNTIVEWKKRIEIKRTRPRKPSKVDDDALRADVEQYPDDYQYERAARFGCATSTIGDALKRLNITVKKRPYGTRKQKQNSESSI